MKLLQQNSGGFTLLEAMIVLAILGILAGLFGINYIHGIRSAELREAATQLSTDLVRARSLAQRTGQDQEIRWIGNTEVKTYQVGGSQKPLPNRVSFSCKSSCSTSHVVYQAPYGELDMTGKVLTVKSPFGGISPLEIRLVGVTGKVILTKAAP